VDRIRRDFLGSLALAGTGSLLGVPSEGASADPPLETTKIRLPRYGVDVACVAPQWIAEELLRAEGFTEVQYVMTVGSAEAIAEARLDLMLSETPALILLLDGGKPVVTLAGVHGGCYELLGTDRVRTVSDLKGKRVAVRNPGRQAFVASMASYVGLDPRTDVTFVMPTQGPEAMQMFVDGKVDAFLGFPPEPQELRAKKIGHVVVSTAVDRPWSQYFCCMAVGNREFVRQHPVAVKRALRAIVKATDICAAEPERVARLLVDRGYVKNYDYALQALREIPYRRWREYDSPDTIRFYALRMHEAGMVKSSPQRIIAQGTDWRFLNELKKELKG